MVASECHFKLDENGEGKCSVPMWCNGMPAGFCDNIAYGEPTEYSHYTGYVPGLACPGHGGPKKPIEEVYDGPIQQCPGDCDECTLYKETEKMMSQEQAEIKELKSLIENVWREYRNLQDQYHKLTGRDYMWLR